MPGTTKRTTDGTPAKRAAKAPAKAAAAPRAKRLVFPSVEWFQALAETTKQDETYRRYGRLNAVIAFVIGERTIQANFDVLDIHDIREASEYELRDADFVIEMEPEHWAAMLDNIKRHGRATDDWTLNTLDLRFDDPIHRNLLEDGFKADMFFRYNPSLQRFFDLASTLDYRVDRSLTAA